MNLEMPKMFKLSNKKSKVELLFSVQLVPNLLVILIIGEIVEILTAELSLEKRHSRLKFILEEEKLLIGMSKNLGDLSYRVRMLS